MSYEKDGLLKCPDLWHKAQIAHLLELAATLDEAKCRGKVPSESSPAH